MNHDDSSWLFSDLISARPKPERSSRCGHVSHRGSHIHPQSQIPTSRPTLSTRCAPGVQKTNLPKDRGSRCTLWGLFCIGSWTPQEPGAEAQRRRGSSCGVWASPKRSAWGGLAASAARGVEMQKTWPGVLVLFPFLMFLSFFL